MRIKNLLFTFWALLIVVACSKEDPNSLPSINYPSIVGDWTIVQFNQTVASNGSIDESQTISLEYPGTMKFMDDGSHSIDFKGTITEYDYIDNGDVIIVKGTNSELKYECRQRSQNQLILDVTTKTGDSEKKQSYVLQRTAVDNSTSIIGSWLIVRIDRLTMQQGQPDMSTTLNYAGTIEFGQNGNEDVEINHQMSHFNYTDRGSYILVKDNATQEKLRYCMRIRTETKLVYDIVYKNGNQEIKEIVILEKMQLNADPAELIGAWQIVRYDYTELNNGVLDNTKTVSLNTPGVIYFKTEHNEKMILNGVTYNNTYYDYGTTLIFNDGVSQQNVIYTIRHRTSDLLVIEKSENVGGKETNQSFVLEKESLLGLWNIDVFDQVVKNNGVIDNAQTVTRYNCGSITFYANGTETTYLSGISYYNNYTDLGDTLKYVDSNGDIWNYTYSERNPNKITIHYSGIINNVERIQTWELTKY